MSSPFEPAEDGGARLPGKLPYERPRRDLDKLPAEPPTYEPAKWKAVHTGLNVIFWAWAAILTVGVLFLALWVGNNFLHKIDQPTMRTIGIGTGYLGLACLAAVFVGHCLCTLAPAVAKARFWAIASVASAVATIVLAVVTLTQWPPQIGYVPPPPEPKPGADAPKEEPKAEAPKVEAEPPKADQPAEGAATKSEPFVPRITFRPLPKFLTVAAYFLSQIFFTLFIRRAALFLHEIPLAESTGGYITLIFTHSLLLGLLPTEALIACFFWLIMVGLEFVIIAWLLILLAGVRRAMV